MLRAGETTGPAVPVAKWAAPGEPGEPAVQGEPAGLPGEPADLPAEPLARPAVGARRGLRRCLVPPTRRPCKLGAGGYAASRSIMPGSVIRTCVGCGVRTAKSDLLRVVAVDGEGVADPAARRPGRGAYLHPSMGRWGRARRRPGVPRALRGGGPLARGRAVRR